jgi:hypothetical protein
MQTSSRTHRPIRKSSDSQSRQSVDCPSSYPLNRAQCLQPPCGSWQATGKPSLAKSFVPVRPDGIPKLSSKSALPSTKQTKKTEVSPALPAGKVALTPPLSSSMKPYIVTKPPFRYQSSKSPDKYRISPSNAPSTSAPVSIASYAPELFFTRLPQSSIASSLRSFQPSLQTTTLPLPVVNYPSSTISPTSDVTGEIIYYYNYATSSSPSIDILPINLVPMAPLLPLSTALPSLQPPLATSAPVISQSASPTVNVVALASQKTSFPSNNALQRTETPSPKVILSPIEILRTTKPRPVMKFDLPSSPSLSQAPLRQRFPKSTQSAPPSKNVPGMISFTTLQNIYRSFSNTKSMS